MLWGLYNVAKETSKQSGVGTDCFSPASSERERKRKEEGETAGGNTKQMDPGFAIFFFVILNYSR